MYLENNIAMGKLKIVIEVWRNAGSNSVIYRGGDVCVYYEDVRTAIIPAVTCHEENGFVVCVTFQGEDGYTIHVIYIEGSNYNTTAYIHVSARADIEGKCLEGIVKKVKKAIIENDTKESLKKELDSIPLEVSEKKVEKVVLAGIKSNEQGEFAFRNDCSLEEFLDGIAQKEYGKYRGIFFIEDQDIEVKGENLLGRPLYKPITLKPTLQDGFASDFKEPCEVSVGEERNVTWKKKHYMDVPVHHTFGEGDDKKDFNVLFPIKGEKKVVVIRLKEVVGICGKSKEDLEWGDQEKEKKEKEADFKRNGIKFSIEVPGYEKEDVTIKEEDINRGSLKVISLKEKWEKYERKAKKEDPEGWAMKYEWRYGGKKGEIPEAKRDEIVSRELLKRRKNEEVLSLKEGEEPPLTLKDGQQVRNAEMHRKLGESKRTLRSLLPRLLVYLAILAIGIIIGVVVDNNEIFNKGENESMQSDKPLPPVDKEIIVKGALREMGDSLGSHPLGVDLCDLYAVTKEGGSAGGKKQINSLIVARSLLEVTKKSLDSDAKKALGSIEKALGSIDEAQRSIEEKNSSGSQGSPFTPGNQGDDDKQRTDGGGSSEGCVDGDAM